MRDQLNSLAVSLLSGAEVALRAEKTARGDAWSSVPSDDVADVHERAAIMEFEGGLPRDQAERRAFALYCDRRKGG